MQGTNYVNNCSYYCHQASGVGLASSIGGGVATIRWEDLHHCDLYVLIGANPASNHPRLMRNLMEIRRRGGKVILEAANPAYEPLVYSEGVELVGKVVSVLRRYA